MAHKKRKALSENLSRSPPRKRIANEDKRDDGSNNNEIPATTESPTKANENNEKRPIQWILPRNEDEKIKEAFAPLLFQQPLGELKNRRRAEFDRPQLPSPIHAEGKENSFEARKDERLDKFRITNELREFHEFVWGENYNYIDNLFREQVGLIGLSSDSSPVTLGGDDEGTLNVTLHRDTNENRKIEAESDVATETASIRIIRRTAHGFVPELFVVLPSNGRVWVNNKEFSNTPSKNDDSDMYIGPLGKFAIVELLYTPIFVWRDRNDTLFNTPAAIPSRKTKARDPKPQDMSAKVTFTPLGAGRDHGSRRSSGDERSGREKSESRASTALEDIINPVILAISSLQQEQHEGFSVEVDGILIRPGRPWIFPLRLFRTTVLVVMQLVETNDGRRITIHVLDPIQHNSDRSIRNDIWRAATGSDTLQRWLTGLDLNLEELKVALPNGAYWVSSPGGLDNDEAFTITALNAWVLAMGLSLNPDWMPPITGPEGNEASVEGSPHPRRDFFREANQLINRHRSGRGLDWEVLYGFLKAQDYIIDNGPPQHNRRFDLEAIRTPGFIESQLNAQNRENMQLKAYRLAEDQREQNRAAEELVLQRASTLRVDFNIDKRLHDETFPSDEAAENFDPCRYLRTRLEKLERVYQSRNSIEYTKLERRRILSSVSAVSQAIAHVGGHTVGFECTDYADENIPRSVPYSGNRSLLLPYSLRNVNTDMSENNENSENVRDVLAVIRPLPNESSRTFTVHVFDHAPWLSSQNLRRTAYELIKLHLEEITSFKDIVIKDENISWIVDPPPSGPELWQLSYYTVLNAWTICLGLHINLDFRAGVGFFERAARIIRLVLDGLADWKLIWSFLRCERFVVDEQVPKPFQFFRTVAERQLEESLSQLRLKVSFPPPTKDISTYKFPQARLSFPTDTWGYSDLKSLSRDIAPLLGAGKSISGLNSEELLQESEKAIEQRENSKARKQRPKDPCKAFKKEFNLLHETFEDEIKSYKRHVNNGGAKEADGTFLPSEDVSRSIASVALAVNKNQDLYNGVSWLLSEFVDAVFQGIVQAGEVVDPAKFSDFYPLNFDRAIRFSRPLITTALLSSHIFLMIIQYDEKQDIKITVLDSRPWHFTKKERHTIHQLGSTLVQFCNWQNESYHQYSNGKKESLDYTTWEPCAIQSTDYTCGYHAIFNGWAAALGLRLNPRFFAKWTSDFLDQAQTLICLTIMGQASSEMIHNYLECINFVVSKQVVDVSKQFQCTVRSEEQKLHEEVGELLSEEVKYWGHFQGKNYTDRIQKISQANRIYFPIGNSRRHDSDWNSDSWPDPYSSYLKDIVNAHQQTIDIEDLDYGQVAYHLRMYSEEFSETDFGDGKTITKLVCSGFREYQKQAPMREPRSEARMFYDYIQVGSMQTGFIEREPDKVQSHHRQYLTALNQGEMKPGKNGVAISFANIFYSSAAIIQAIDEKQQEETEQASVGELTPATQDAIEMGRGGELGTQPGRCLLMPFEFQETEEQKPHYFLVILQKEANTDSDSRFRVYFLDSNPNFWDNSSETRRFKTFEQVKTIAHKMQWTKHRDTETHIQFCSEPRHVRVAEQEDNNSSGYHTIFNTWILALGMTPKITCKWKWRDVYREFREMIRFAIEGRLDWRTLVAWLFESDLTVEKRIGPVTLERAFDLSKNQMHIEYLMKHVAQPRLHDGLLGTLTEEAAPHIHNNIDFSKSTWQFEDYEDSGEDDDEESNKEEEGPDTSILYRIMEDIDMLGYKDGVDDWSSFFTELTQTAYEDLERG